ncbi:phage tail protein [Marinimicrobium agarilyticum]|uniref:phage tail protein n=1 Tax=Marinimicrobium agarilyticum TaxID=306546 RepID=UPI0003FCC2F2|nr:tail fiber protein [Marinimicrobium agarilyticum]
MEPFIGEIQLMPISFVPRGWELCAGQLLSVSQNTALFSIIGITYGGDGRTNFRLPDLRGQVVPGIGSGPGLTPWAWGETRGEDTVAITEAEMPQHNHGLRGLNSPGSSEKRATDSFLAQDDRAGSGVVNYLTGGDSPINTELSSQATTTSGSGQPHENRQPFLTMMYCIAVNGIFPNRS